MDLRELMAAIGALPVPPPVSEESLPASLRLPLRPLLENLEAWREFALQVQALGLEGDSGENLTERVEQLENMLRNVRAYGGAEVRTGPAGISIGMRPAEGPSEPIASVIYGVHRGKVLALYNSAGAAYTDYDTDGFIHFLLVAPELPGSTDFTEDEEDYLYIKATEIGAAGTSLPEVGYLDIAADDEIGYVLGGLTEQVPGLAPYFPFHGQLYLFAGAEGGRLASAYEAVGGPGIAVAAIEDSNQHKVSVELATDPGLEFDAETDAGKLRAKVNAAKAMLRESAGLGVKANTDYGVSVSSSGVAVDIAASNPGLQFVSGDLAVLPNPDKAVVVEAAGVGVIANASKSISVTAGGVGVGVEIADTNPGLKRVNGDLAFYPKALGGLEVEATGVSVKADLKSIYVDGATGDVRVWTDGTSGIAIDEAVKGVYIDLDTTHLEFDAGALLHSLQAENVTQISLTVADGALVARIWKGGVEIDNSPNNNIIITFDTAGHITDAAFG